MLGFDWRFTLADNDLPKVIGSTRLAGIEVAFPLIDDDLLDFSLKLPPEYKLKGLQLRWFFKEALKDFLPPEIITKKKQGFGLPFGHWALKNPALQKLARESLETLIEQNILKREFVTELFKTHLPAFPGYYGEMVWISMMLGQWLSQRPFRQGEALSAGAASEVQVGRMDFAAARPQSSGTITCGVSRPDSNE
jgi:asparagine synthase (glutamine-hydrolysing)